MAGKEAKKEEQAATPDPRPWKIGDDGVHECPSCGQPKELSDVWDAIKESRANQKATNERVAEIDGRVSKAVESIEKKVESALADILSAVTPETEEHDFTNPVAENHDFTGKN